MKLFTSSALAALILLGASAPVFAGEEKVKESDVPKPALEAVQKKYPKAKMTGFEKEEEDGKVLYEVKIEDGTRKIEVELSPDGKIIVEEEAIPADALPKEVKQALAASKYAKWTLKRAEKIVKEENVADPSYELLLTDGKLTFEVVFDKTGKIGEEEEKKAKKGEKGEKEGKGEDDGD